MNKKSIYGIDVSQQDNRGRHIPHNKYEQVVLNTARQHIESHPVMDSHYCRSSSKKKYLCGDQNITKMAENYVQKMGIILM